MIVLQESGEILEDYWLCWVTADPVFPLDDCIVQGVQLEGSRGKPPHAGDGYVEVQFMIFDKVHVCMMFVA
jgi:hypothetical protein